MVSSKTKISPVIWICCGSGKISVLSMAMSLSGQIDNEKIIVNKVMKG
jgi:hypothetical protein